MHLQFRVLYFQLLGSKVHIRYYKNLTAKDYRPAGLIITNNNTNVHAANVLENAAAPVPAKYNKGISTIALCSRVVFSGPSC